MKTPEQIHNRLRNYRKTLEGLVVSGQANKTPGSVTEWHKKQIAVLEAKVQELEWMLNAEPGQECIIHATDWYGKCFKCGEQVFNRNYDNKGQSLAQSFLTEGEIYQKDDQGLYCYISDNGKHLTNLTALLESFEQYLRAVSEANKHKGQ